MCTFLSRCKVVTSEAAPDKVPVREIDLIAYLPLVQLTENSCAPTRIWTQAIAGRRLVRLRRYFGSESVLVHWATETDFLVQTELELYDFAISKRHHIQSVVVVGFDKVAEFKLF